MNFMNTLELATKVLPIFLLFGLGYLFRRTRFMSAQTASELKKLVANVTLPALLFRAFASMEPGREELYLALLMFALCAVLLVGAHIAMRLFRRPGDIRAYMVSGFEAGMLGYALFLSVFSTEALPVFATVDLGQVLFVFVILMPLLLARATVEKGERGSVIRGALKNIVLSPVIWSLVLGLVLGGIGRRISYPSETLAPIVGFLEILGNLTVPVIALAIGYELNFQRSIMGKALVFVLIRKIVLLGLALLLVRILPVDNPLIPIAFFTMLLMPPPFVVTLAARDSEQGLISGILSLSTVVSIPAFAVAVLLTGV